MYDDTYLDHIAQLNVYYMYVQSTYNTVQQNFGDDLHPWVC